MAVHLFAAIDVGSYEIEMKIYELSRKNGIRLIDDIMHRIDLGTDTYYHGRLSAAHVSQLKATLREYAAIMKNYGVEAYRACGTSAFREMYNSSLVRAQIEQDTGIQVEVLANAEQRFLDYKSVAFKGADFEKVLADPTAIVDLGGGSIQISLFEKDRLVATQNIRLGILIILERLHRIRSTQARAEGLIEEMVNSQLAIFRKLYMKNREIRNIIVVDDYISEVARKNGPMLHKSGVTGTGEFTGAEFIEVSAFNDFLEKISAVNRQELSRMLSISDDYIPLLQISAVTVRCIAKMMHAQQIWVPGVTLCDGIAYDYAQKNRYISAAHDFEGDIIACAQETGKRYKCSVDRSTTMWELAERIFDATKRYHGMGDREKLLLRIAIILHDCGKYISMTNLAECSYNILMSTEIIGVSGTEQEIIANVVRFNHDEFVYYESPDNISELSPEAYMVITKLTAILRVANGLDRSHKKKFSGLKVRVREGELIITVDAKKDITLEKGLFGRRAEFFEEVIGLTPVIRQR